MTARFNLHLLERMNSELGANFRLEGFRHYAIYDPVAGRIAMFLVSLQPQDVTIGDAHFHFERGEPIRTEYSYKYTRRQLAELAAEAGFAVQRVWTDPQELFSVQFLRSESDASTELKHLSESRPKVPPCLACWSSTSRRFRTRISSRRPIRRCSCKSSDAAPRESPPIPKIPFNRVVMIGAATLSVETGFGGEVYRLTEMRLLSGPEPEVLKGFWGMA